MDQPAIYQPANFPRVYASDRPPGQRVVFNQFYPSGLPVVYKMLETTGSQGVIQTYVEDHLPVGFYTNPRADARAVFSTSNGSRPFSEVDEIVPQRRLHLWSRDEIQTVCNSLRKIFWENMRELKVLKSWDDLWTWFDARDIYLYGALNLWNVLNTLLDENRILETDFENEAAYHIGHFADTWVAKEGNAEKLVRWDPSDGPLLPLLTVEDWKAMGNVTDDAMPIISKALRRRRELILAGESTGQHVPRDLVSSLRKNELQNWLGMFDSEELVDADTNPSTAGEKIFLPNGLPSPPEATSHHASPATRNAPAPFYVHEGNHYYMPPQPDLTPEATTNSAVEALHESSQAPYQGIPIANGSSRPLPKRPVKEAASSTSSEESLEPSPEQSDARTRSRTPSPTQSLRAEAGSPTESHQLVTPDISPPGPSNNVGPNNSFGACNNVGPTVVISEVYTPTKDKSGLPRAQSTPPSSSGHKSSDSETTGDDEQEEDSEDSVSPPFMRPSTAQPRAE